MDTRAFAEDKVIIFDEIAKEFGDSKHSLVHAFWLLQSLLTNQEWLAEGNEIVLEICRHLRGTGLVEIGNYNSVGLTNTGQEFLNRLQLKRARKTRASLSRKCETKVFIGLAVGTK